MTLLTPKQAAEMLFVSTQTLRRWEDENKITSIRTGGGHRRYEQADVVALHTKIQNNSALMVKKDSPAEKPDTVQASISPPVVQTPTVKATPVAQAANTNTSSSPQSSTSSAPKPAPTSSLIERAAIALFVLSVVALVLLMPAGLWFSLKQAKQDPLAICLAIILGSGMIMLQCIICSSLIKRFDAWMMPSTSMPLILGSILVVITLTMPAQMFFACKRILDINEASIATAKVEAPKEFQRLLAKIQCQKGKDVFQIKQNSIIRDLDNSSKFIISYDSTQIEENFVDAQRYC